MGAISAWAVGTGVAVLVVGLVATLHARKTRPTEKGGPDGVATFWSLLAVATCVLLLFGQGMQAFDVRFDYTIVGGGSFLQGWPAA